MLPSSCSQQELAEEASGVIEAVLQGRNSVVLAMGQPAFGKPHTLLGEDPNDPQAVSSSLGMLAATHNCCTGLKPCFMAAEQCRGLKFCITFFELIHGFASCGQNLRQYAAAAADYVSW